MSDSSVGTLLVNKIIIGISYVLLFLIIGLIIYQHIKGIVLIDFLTNKVLSVAGIATYVILIKTIDRDVIIKRKRDYIKRKKEERKQKQKK